MTSTKKRHQLPPKTAAELGELRELRAANRASELAKQQATVERLSPDAYVQIAIGSTGGAKNVGWELHQAGRAPRYLRTREEAIGAFQT